MTTPIKLVSNNSIHHKATIKCEDDLPDVFSIESISSLSNLTLSSGCISEKRSDWLFTSSPTKLTLALDQNNLWQFHLLLFRLLYFEMFPSPPTPPQAPPSPTVLQVSYCAIAASASLITSSGVGKWHTDTHRYTHTGAILYWTVAWRAYHCTQS